MILETWELHLVSRTGTSLGRLDGVVSAGSFTGNVNAQIRWTGGVTIRDPDRYDWNATRIKLIHVYNGKRENFGVYIARVKAINETATGVIADLDLFDRTIIASEDAITASFTVKAGTNVTSAVRQILESTGELGVSITPTTDTVRSDMTWEAGTSKLKIINELADAAGYFALWCDLSGQYRFEPYRAPSARPVAYQFADHETAVHVAGASSSRPVTVHNQVVCVSQETGDAPALIGVARNEDPESPHSFQAQGRWVTRFESGIEAATQAVIDSHAQRLLAEEGLGGGVYERQMLARPFELNSVVLDADGQREVIENMQLSLKTGSLMKLKSRQVIS